MLTSIENQACFKRRYKVIFQDNRLARFEEEIDTGNATQDTLRQIISHSTAFTEPVYKF